MGMYTELQLNCELKKCDIGVAFALGETEVNCGFDNVWCGMLQGESSYFPYDAQSSCTLNKWEETFLNIRCNIKNYKNQLEEFLAYLHPLIDAIEGDFLGFIRYEEHDIPTLIYYDKNEILFKEVS